MTVHADNRRLSITVHKGVYTTIARMAQRERKTIAQVVRELLRTAIRSELREGA